MSTHRTTDRLAESLSSTTLEEFPSSTLTPSRGEKSSPRETSSARILSPRGTPLRLFITLFTAILIISPAAAETHSWAAKVNGAVIPLKTFSEVKEVVEKVFSESGEADPATAEGKETIKYALRSVLDQLIDTEVLIQSARTMGLSASAEAIRIKIEEEKNHFPSVPEFHKSLALQGITVDILQKNIENQLLVEKVTFQLSRDVAVEEKDIKEFYNQNIDLFVQPERVHAYEIVLADRSPVDSIKKELSGKASIEALVEKYSIGSSKQACGNLGLVERSDLPPSSVKVLFGTKPRSLSKPVETDYGVTVYWVKEKFPQVVTPVSDVRERIRGFIKTRKARTLFLDWLAREREKASIEYGTSVKWIVD